MKRENDKTLEEKWADVNQKYLDIYIADLKASGISQKTFGFYMDYAETYINYFLLRYTEEETGPDDIEDYAITDENHGVLENGCKQLGYYISYYYIHKDTSATPGNLKKTVQAIKKFYECMCEHEIVSKESYDSLCFEIECSLDGWLEECKMTG